MTIIEIASLERDGVRLLIVIEAGEYLVLNRGAIYTCSTPVPWHRSTLAAPDASHSENSNASSPHASSGKSVDEGRTAPEPIPKRTRIMKSSSRAPDSRHRGPVESSKNSFKNRATLGNTIRHVVDGPTDAPRPGWIGAWLLIAEQDNTPQARAARQYRPGSRDPVRAPNDSLYQLK